MLLTEYNYEKDIEVKQKEAEERLVLRLHQKGLEQQQIAELTEKTLEEVRQILLEKDLH